MEAGYVCSFPGGRMDPGESALDTALREAREEVGLEAELVTVRGEPTSSWAAEARSRLRSARDLLHILSGTGP